MSNNKLNMGSRTKQLIRKKNNEPKSMEEAFYEELREFAQEGSNKFCFDCHQRGPTYVNMTIGSFICMRCSGLLRGLTPPHRVKSMSVATYTQEEMETIKERGNDYCKQVWLATFEGSEPTDTSGERDIQDFMIQKYERKRYYLDPKVSGVKLRQIPTSMDNSSKQPIEEEFLKIWQSYPPPGPSREEFQKALKEHKENKASDAKIVKAVADSTTSNDFVADFSKADIFVASPPQQATPTMNGFNNNNNGSFSNGNAFTSFANFDNNPIFITQAKTPVQSKLSSQLVSPPPSEDRYAALKDLDNALKSQHLQEHQQVDWAAGQPQQNGSAFGMMPSQLNSVNSFGSPTSKDMPTVWNPFSSNQFVHNPWSTSEPVPNNSASIYNANPFRATNGYNGNQVQNNLFRPQQTTMFPSHHVNGFRETVMPNNPFKMGSSPSANGVFSNNPFL